MGAFVNALGLGGGTAGTGFNVPGAPYSGAQQQGDYNQAQQAYQQQQALLNALQGQGGLQKQQDIYGQYGNIAAGQGPNPAQAMLAQATGQNVANQAALMAGQRGAGANVGLMARNAANVGANAQQQAAGQAATMQANQALSALGSQAGLANQMAANQIGATTTGLQGAQSQESLTNQANQANAALQAGLAQQGMSNQAGLVGGILGGVGKAIMAAEGGEIPHYADGGSVGGSHFGNFMSGFAGDNPTYSTAGAPIAAAPVDFGPDKQKQKPTTTYGGTTAGVDYNVPVSAPDAGFSPSMAPNQMPTVMAAAEGGEIHRHYIDIANRFKMAEGSEVPFKGYNPEKHSRTGGLNDEYREKYNREHGSHLKRPVTGHPKPGTEAAGRKKSFCARMKGVKGPTSEGGKLTPKGAALKRWNCHAHGGQIHDDHDSECVHYAHGGEHNFKTGGHVPGTPEFPGNDYRNDTVKALLSPGEVVIPNKIMQSSDPVNNAAKFVAKIMAKKGVKRLK